MKYFKYILFMIAMTNLYAGDTPLFKDYKIQSIHKAKNHPLIMDNFAKTYRTRLKYAVVNSSPTFAGQYIVTNWGCGTSGCNTGAVINAKTGKVIPWPVGLSSVYPLKPKFEEEDGQEHIYKIDSRLMIFAGNLDGAAQGDGGDSVEFYEIKNDRFNFIKSKPYGKSLIQTVKKAPEQTKNKISSIPAQHPANAYTIEVAHNDELFIINGEKFEAQTYCLGWSVGETVLFIEGSPYGTCASAKLYNSIRRESCNVWCE